MFRHSTTKNSKVENRGGAAACATTRPTTHQNPTYVIDEVVHTCVANMPSAVARTATFALNNATLPFIIRLADKATGTPCAGIRICWRG